jgi:hypothetical protein
MADEKLAMVLERAGGPVADGDVGEVRRPARARVRRRRGAAGVGVGVGVAVVAAGLSVAGPGVLGLPGDGDDPGVVASGDAASQPGGVLFERRLDDGSVLRVRSTDDASMVAVEVGDAVVERLPIRQGLVTALPADAAVPWDIATMVPCPGDERRVLRAWTDEGRNDEMSLDTGLAVVAVPPPPALVAGPMRTGEGTLIIGSETMDGSQIEGEGSRGFTYIDFLDADGLPVRPATVLGTGLSREVLRVPIGSIDHLPAGPIPPPDDPEHPCG